MLSNKFNIVIDENFTKEEFLKIIEEFSKIEELFWLAGNLEWYVNDMYDFDFKEFMTQVNEGYFEQITLTDKEAKRIKNETTIPLDLSNTLFCKAKNKDEMKKFMDTDEFRACAITVQKNIVTNVFFYTEGSNDMIIIIDCEDSSKFQKFFNNYIKKNKKELTFQHISR